jgi:hypothetical protein
LSNACSIKWFMSTSCGGWQKYSNMRCVCYVLTTIYAKLRTVHRFSRQVSNLFSSDCFLQFKATKSQMERTARILTRKKDAIQHKMVMFAWWRKTKRNILIKPSLRCSLKPIWILEASNNSCAPLLVLQNTKWYISSVGTTFLQLASMLSNKNSEPSTIMRWDGYFFDKE